MEKGKMNDIKHINTSNDENSSEKFLHGRKNCIIHTPFHGCHPKSVVKKTYSPHKRIKLSPSIRSELRQREFIDTFRSLWTLGESAILKDVEIIKEPFKVCIMDSFLENNEIVDSIRQDFNNIEWFKRNVDLYEFYQSADLKHVQLQYIKSFYELMKYTAMSWVAELTGLDLVDISATCSCYTNTDYLLVHDDQREDRMIAFIYYLTTPQGWIENKGGCLELLSKDGGGNPLKVIRSIIPKNNRLIIFPVTNESFHQVSEVLSLEDPRLSINGWFHAKLPQTFNVPHFEYPADSLFGKNIITPKCHDILLESWIEEKFLNREDNTLEDIQKHIEENSEISLRDFFKVEALAELKMCLDIIEQQGNHWEMTVPLNRSCYEVLKNDALPLSLQSFLNVFQSKQFFIYLKTITDLDLKSMRYEFQKWTSGSYSLLSDHDWNNTQELDIIVYFPYGDQNDIIGGKIQYVNTEEEIQEAFITIEPVENTLNVVYRDTARYTEYFSNMSKCKKFYLLICSYTE